MLTFFRAHPLTKKSGVLLPHDNTRLHTTVCTTETIIHFEWTVFLHPPIVFFNFEEEHVLLPGKSLSLPPPQPMAHCILQCLITGIMVFSQPFFQRSAAHQASYSMGTKFFPVGKEVEA